MFKILNGENDFTSIYTPHEIQKIINDSLTYYKKQAEEANIRAEKTHDEVVAEVHNEFEKENKLLKKQLHLSYGRFGSESELENFKEFTREHKNCWDGQKITSGRRFYIKEYGTGIGTGFIVVCPWCQKEKDITDISNW